MGVLWQKQGTARPPTEWRGMFFDAMLLSARADWPRLCCKYIHAETFQEPSSPSSSAAASLTDWLTDSPSHWLTFTAATLHSRLHLRLPPLPLYLLRSSRPEPDTRPPSACMASLAVILSLSLSPRETWLKSLDSDGPWLHKPLACIETFLSINARILLLHLNFDLKQNPQLTKLYCINKS